MNNSIPVKEGSFVSFDGTRIYYEERGQGEPLVFVYGLACLINHWHYQIDYFSKSYHCISFDIRGHHKSGVPGKSENLSLEAIATDISYLLRNIGVREAHFLGHSLGSQTLLKTFDLYPEIFKSMTIINGFAENPFVGGKLLTVVDSAFDFIKTQVNKNPDLINLAWRSLINNPLSIFASGVLGGFNLKLTQLKDIEIYAKGVSNVPINVFLCLFEEMLKFKGTPVAKRINVPTLIIGGERDFVTPNRFQAALHKAIQGSIYVNVPYASHCTQLDFPDYVNLQIERFLNELEER